MHVSRVVVGVPRDPMLWDDGRDTRRRSMLTPSVSTVVFAVLTVCETIRIRVAQIAHVSVVNHPQSARPNVTSRLTLTVGARAIIAEFPDGDGLIASTIRLPHRAILSS
jgi:hypothetical protein